MKLPQHGLVVAGAATALFLSGGCKPAGSTAAQSTGSTTELSAAAQTWVAPGKKDDYYVFYSGGHSGQVFVAGLPSMRHITTIPVFGRYPGTGYGYDDDSKKLLGDYTWGDVHHPGLSKTNGDYDGRWLFVNDNANNRIARIDLRDFKTHQVLGPIPNSMGNHGSSFVTSNSEYILCATRFSVPLPKGRYADPNDYAKEFNGMVSGIKVDPKTGELSVGWQILTPPFDWDLGSTGKGPSEGWAFWTSYNTEMAHDQLEANASQLDRDYGAVVNWRAAEQAVKDGKATVMDGVPVIDPAKVPGVLYFLPIPKSPHGIDTDPSGRWIASGGKLQPVVSVFDFLKIKDAITKNSFEKEFRGIPVLKYEDVLEGEVPVGLGPLHTQYDEKGNGYTSLFIESAVAKWKLPPWTAEEKADLNKVVVDKIPVHYNIGHLAVAGGDTVHPYGKYLIAMNKMSKGRHITVGPSEPEDSELIDISGNKMKEIYETFTEPEPHFAQILKVDTIKPIEVYPKDENKNPDAIWDAKDASVTRHGNVVEVKMLAIRSHFVPDRIDAQVGDEVVIHVTNVEQTPDMIHGLGFVELDSNIVMDPGETKTVRLQMKKPGVFPYYCTNFCSALHQEMQGYLAVKPATADLEVNVSVQSERAVVVPRSHDGAARTSRLREYFRHEHVLLRRPMNLRSRVLLLAAAVAVATAAFLPLWQIRLVAPQYQEGLALHIYAYKLVGGNGGQDISEINTLNHYIGMHPIQQSDFVEMKWMPFAFGIFALLALRGAAIGRMISLIDLGVLFAYFGAFSLGNFAYRLYSYGHQLDAHAPMHIKPFTPVLLGSQQIANFVQSSLPQSGALLLGLFPLLIGAAMWCSRKEEP